jgi:hypothetical protein
VILPDSSAIYALASRTDPRHREAVETLDQIDAAGEPLPTYSAPKRARPSAGKPRRKRKADRT